MTFACILSGRFHRRKGMIPFHPYGAQVYVILSSTGEFPCRAPGEINTRKRFEGA